jgi:hypothetical protein
MAVVFAPFRIQRTMCNMTFYVMEGRNFVRKKSSLTRRKVLYAPQFARTRHNAGLMGKASQIGSAVYNELPEYWRRGWMYRSFTGEAYKMIKAGKKEKKIQEALFQRYVEPVVNKQPDSAVIAALPVQPKRAYHKRNTAYWRKKTFRATRSRTYKAKLLYHAAILGRASKISSKLYARIPLRYRRRSCYQQLIALAMQLLKEEWNEADIIAALLPTLPGGEPQKCLQPVAMGSAGGSVSHASGHYYFITSLYKRFEYVTTNVFPIMTDTVCDPALTREPYPVSTCL